MTVTLTGAVAVAVGRVLDAVASRCAFVALLAASTGAAAASSGPIVVRSFFSLRKKDSINAAASTGTRARKIGGSA